MWINQFISNGEYDQISSDKSKRGILAYALMGMVVITSLKPVRRKCYQLFWIAHVVFFVGFFAAISYHTPYSRPWIYPCAAIYGYDLLVRMLRYRIKDATLIPVDETLTMIHIPDCDAGWLPTQHVFLRVMKGSGIFESHPFTITNAASTPLSASPRGIILYAKIAGDWTDKLHVIASKGDSGQIDLVDNGNAEERERFLKDRTEQEGLGEKLSGGSQVGLDHPGTRVQVMFDGPYGGLKLDLGEYENVLLVGGGSGITFILGSIEEALRVRAKGQGPRRVDVAWVVRDISTITALSPTLLYLHNLATRLSVDLTYHLYLSNPPNPLPTIPAILPQQSTTLSPFRPEIAQLVREALPISTHSSDASAATAAEQGSGRPNDTALLSDTANNQRETSPDEEGGGLAVIACGPEGIVSEAKNAVACLSIAERIRAGGIGFHGECYAL
ncbi:ferric-chelate reductase [Kwoniella heveanensis BCC8398]|uniref:Ferric-chelate reductase n=1 Tax=Kwoniella heveanensis BCC8398 TaxID=1296120 RepID=A0A1B9H0B0_9TREE|nr:ferric-chelate reductase [Kwoniella heveanensis BCC8398]